jgi:uncharacterized protein YndB with AHSA1/START domain
MAPVKEISFERTLNAPVETVWNAWTDPEKIKSWWGPDNVTIPECVVDLHVGGRFYIVMEAGEAMGDFKGTRWPMEATFTEVEQYSKLAYTAKAWTEGDEEGTDIHQIAELTLVEDNGKTNMRLKISLTKVGSKAGMAVEGMKWGYNQHFDKLVAYLDT